MEARTLIDKGDVSGTDVTGGLDVGVLATGAVLEAVGTKFTCTMTLEFGIKNQYRLPLQLTGILFPTVSVRKI